MKSLDPTRAQAHVSSPIMRPAELLGEAGQGWQLTEKLYDRAAVLFAFEQVGGSLAALDQACEYAKNRYAFGRSIASFQAIKHKLADMYVAATLARSNCYYGAWALSTDADELALAAAAARLSAIDAYHQCAKETSRLTVAWVSHGNLTATCIIAGPGLWRSNLGNKWQWEDKLISALESRGEVLA